MSQHAISCKKQLWKQKQHQQDYIFCQCQAAAAVTDAAAATALTAVTKSLADLSLNADQKTAEKVFAICVNEKNENSVSAFMITAFTTFAVTDEFSHLFSCTSAIC